MKKIATLTFHDTTNYGAALQAYALNKQINNFGFESDILRYECANIAKRELPKKFKEVRGGLKSKLFWFLTHSRKAKKLNHIRSFLNENASMSKDAYTSDTVAEANSKYDKFIVGSDLVWETTITDHDYNFYLKFAPPKKRYSYAASFGYDSIPEEDYEACKSCLNDFEHITVRESRAKQIVNDLLPDKSADLVCDPTLLLSQKDWLEHTDKKIKAKKNEYIFLYFLDKEGIMLNKAREIAKAQNKKIVVYNDSLRPVKNAINVFNLSVEQFLSYLKNSYLNITGSYHGVCFSLIFEQQFAIVNRAHSSRITSLLETLNLLDRNLIINPDCCNDVIDYSAVNRRLDEFKTHSLECLKSMLEDK